MSMLARLIGAGLTAIALLAGGPAEAADSPPVAVDAAGLALHGYDPVAYFKDGEAQKGDAAISTRWMGATWLFASAAHRDAFAADPEAYAPQFGGYCAYAVSRGHVAEADPQVWSIVDDKLYVNFGTGVQKRWQQDVPGNIARATSNWPAALRDPNAHKATTGADR
jgi:YHS domain-containing protein